MSSTTSVYQYYVTVDVKRLYLIFYLISFPYLHTYIHTYILTYSVTYLVTNSLYGEESLRS
jgi:hypothetical protein